MVKQLTRGSELLDKCFTGNTTFYKISDTVLPVRNSDHKIIMACPDTRSYCKGKTPLQLLEFIDESFVCQCFVQCQVGKSLPLHVCDDEVSILMQTLDHLYNTYFPLKTVKRLGLITQGYGSILLPYFPTSACLKIGEFGPVQSASKLGQSPQSQVL